MPRDASGNYTLPPGNPVLSDTVIESTWANSTLSDIAVQLNNVLTRDGVLGPTAPMKGVDGTEALPAWTFASQPNSGWYRTATYLGLSYNGVLRTQVDATAIQFFVQPRCALVPAGDSDLVNKKFLTDPGTGYLPLAGGTLTGALYSNVSVGAPNINANSSVNTNQLGTGSGNLLITAPTMSLQNSAARLEFNGTNFRPAVDASVNLGSSTERWATIYAFNFTGNALTATTASTVVNGATNQAGRPLAADPGADSQSVGIGGMVCARADLGAASQSWGTAVAMSPGVATLTLFTSSGGTPVQTIAYGTWRFIGNAQGANGFWIRIA
jgi:hypothetical protein